jgi:phenylacetate-CoA ligase
MRKLTEQLHDWASLKLLVPAARVRRSGRRLERPVIKAYREGLSFRQASLGWSDEQKRAWVLERLRFSVRRAYTETGFYKLLLDEIGFEPHSNFTFDDFARLPVLERDMVRTAGPQLLSRAVPAELIKNDATGGSTGEPTEIRLGPEEQGWRESAGDWFHQQLGIPPGSRTAFFWGHHLDAMRTETIRERLYAFQNNVRWFDCFRLSEEVLDRYHRELSQYRPACLVAYAGALAALAKHLQDRACQPSYPTRCLVTGAEKLLPDQRRTIEAVFNRPVNERYGSRDVGFIAYQMQPASSLLFEIDWSNLLIEPEAEGQSSSILVTKLHADAMPMLRYRIGDLAAFPAGISPGSPTLTINEVIGRETDRIFLPDGRWMHGIQLPHLMKDYPVSSFMLHQKADYSAELKLVPSNGFDGLAKTAILGTLQSSLPGIHLTMTIVEEIPKTRSNKWRPVVSEVDPAATRGFSKAVSEVDPARAKGLSKAV